MENFAATLDKMEDVRKEQCAGICVGAVLAEEPQIVVSGYIQPTLYLTQLEGLVHEAVSVAQIRRLRLRADAAKADGAQRLTGEDGSSKYGMHITPQNNDWRLTIRSNPPNS